MDLEKKKNWICVKWVLDRKNLGYFRPEMDEIKASAEKRTPKNLTSSSLHSTSSTFQNSIFLIFTGNLFILNLQIRWPTRNVSFRKFFFRTTLSSNAWISLENVQRSWLAKCTFRQWQPNLIWQLSSFNFF